MTKLGLITTYPRLLYSSAAKKDFYSPNRQISRTSSVWKDEQTTPPKSSTESENPENPKSKDDPVKIFDFSKGEIGNKTERKAGGPQSLEEAKNLLIKQYDWTRNQIEDKREMTRKQFEEKMESVRVIFGATPSKPRTPDEEWYYKRVSSEFSSLRIFSDLPNVNILHYYII